MRSILRLVLLVLLMQAGTAVAQEAFKFEDYRERTAFRTAIAQHFPVGSSYLAFKQAVLPAGAKAARDEFGTQNPNYHVFKKNERPGVATMVTTNWTIEVTVEGDTITAITPTLVTGASVKVIE